ncbi:MAG: carbohydrate binding domain-containing protein [Bacteroidales bacterium]|nr:carbohydrate binding domain-containing protein [Bacteroidales bacterium]
MKKLLFIIAFATSLSVNAQTNFVANGNFEGGTTEGWNSQSWEGSMLLNTDDSEPLSGTKSLVITILTSTGNHILAEDFWKQNINWRMPISKGAKYKISFKAVASDPCEIIGSFDQNFAPFGQIAQNTFQLTATPQTYEYTTGALPDVVGCGNFTFFLGNLEAGTQIWLDDISITEVTSPLTDGNICNGDFEADAANDSYYGKPQICGWSEHMDGATVNYEIDQTTPISGNKSLKITGVSGTPATDGWKAQLIWMFSPIIGKTYMIEFKAKSTADFKMAVEAWDDWNNNTRINQLFWQEFDITNEVKTFKLGNVSAVATVYNRYFLAFWLGLIPNGASVWIDDIKFYQSDGDASAVKEIKENDHIYVKSNYGHIVVETPNNGIAYIYSISGQLIQQKNIVAGVNQITSTNGLYMVQVVEENVIVKSTKVLVQ